MSDSTIIANRINVNGKVRIANICISAGTTPTTGLYISGSYIRIDNCYIAGAFNYGIDFDDSKYTGNIKINNCIVYGAKKAGIKIVSYTENTIVNNVEINNCYVTGIGTNTHDYTAESTKLESGHGIHINGGRGISIINTVVEYSSGVGILLDAVSIDLTGVSVISPYLEHNKYANIYANNKNNSKVFKRVHISGEFYSDGNVGLPSDALPNRELVVVNNTSLVYDKGLKVNSNDFSDVSKKARFFAHPIYPTNLYPYDRVADIVSEFETVTDLDGEKVLLYNSSRINYATNIPIISGATYTMTFKEKFVGSGSPSFGLVVSPIDGGSATYKLATSNDAEWTQKTITFTADADAVARIYVEGVGAQKLLYVKDVKIIAG
jgi:hypothetical protein